MSAEPGTQIEEGPKGSSVPGPGPFPPVLSHMEPAALGSPPPKSLHSPHCPRCSIAGACVCHLCCLAPLHPQLQRLSAESVPGRGGLGFWHIAPPTFLLAFNMNVSCLASLFQKIIQHLEREGLKNIIFTNCVKDENVKQVGFIFF